MQTGEESKLDDAITEIAVLMAAAYRRRARIRLVQVGPESLPSTKELDCLDAKRVHELTLTSRRKESTRS